MVTNNLNTVQKLIMKLLYQRLADIYSTIFKVIYITEPVFQQNTSLLAQQHVPILLNQNEHELLVNTDPDNNNPSPLISGQMQV